MAEGQRGGWALFFLATIILGSIQPTEGFLTQPVLQPTEGFLSQPVLQPTEGFLSQPVLQPTEGFLSQPVLQPTEGFLSQPVLQPTEAAPLIGTYTLKTPAGKSCLKATIGVEYIVIIKTKPWYFSLDPARVKTSGYCGHDVALLSLTLPNNASILQFTFKKEGNVSYVSRLMAQIFPVCNECGQSYQGVVAGDQLFSTAYGQSFKCKSQSVFVMSEELSIKLVPLQLQAFTVPKGQYGPEVECLADFNKRVIPVIAGAVVVAIFLTTLLTFLVIKDHHRPGYSRI